MDGLRVSASKTADGVVVVFLVWDTRNPPFSVGFERKPECGSLPGFLDFKLFGKTILMANERFGLLCGQSIAKHTFRD